MICDELKAIRKRIAEANSIEYAPVECHHEGDCAGTCPRCESEVRYLEGQLRRRSRLGHAVMIGGLALGLSALASCGGDEEGGYTTDAGYLDDSEDTCMVSLGDTVSPGDVTVEQPAADQPAAEVPQQK